MWGRLSAPRAEGGAGTSRAGPTGRAGMRVPGRQVALGRDIRGEIQH